MSTSGKSQGTIALERKSYERILQTYTAAVKAGATSDSSTFMFDGAELLVTYAEYLIEYMGTVLSSAGVIDRHQRMTASELRERRRNSQPAQPKEQ